MQDHLCGYVSWSPLDSATKRKRDQRGELCLLLPGVEEVFKVGLGFVFMLLFFFNLMKKKTHNRCDSKKMFFQKKKTYIKPSSLSFHDHC